MLPNVPDRELDPPEPTDYEAAVAGEQRRERAAAIDALAAQMRASASDVEWLEATMSALEACLWPSVRSLHIESEREKARLLAGLRRHVEGSGSEAADFRYVADTIRAALALHYRARAEEALS